MRIQIQAKRLSKRCCQMQRAFNLIEMKNRKTNVAKRNRLRTMQANSTRKSTRSKTNMTVENKKCLDATESDMSGECTSL